MAYALADRGTRLLAEHDGTALANRARSRNNARVRRPFIEHQLEVMDFYVALVIATRDRDDIRFVPPEELVAKFPEPPSDIRNPFAMRVKVSHNGRMHEIGLVPDLVFGLMFPDGSKRCFMAEIDRGTMPITRSDIRQSSFGRKMCAYLTVHATKLHQRQFGWKTFRTLVVTTHQSRIRSMMAVLQQIPLVQSGKFSLLHLANSDELNLSDPLLGVWRDQDGHRVSLI